VNGTHPAGEDEPTLRGRSLDGTELPALETPDGVPRLLAAFPTGDVTQPLYGATVPVLPPDQWKAFDKHAKMVPILNQESHGSCVGHGADTTLMVARAVAGMKFQKLSPTWIYANINGGRDAGSIPSDAVKFLLDHGTCLFEQCGTNDVFLNRIPNRAECAETAQRFRLSLAYQIRSWEERVTAALTGFMFLDTVRVGGSFNNLSAEGVPPVSQGTGNHAVCGGEGLKKLKNGKWAIKYRNSWSESWGIDGFFYLTEDHFAHQPQAECFAFQLPHDDLAQGDDAIPAELVA